MSVALGEFIGTAILIILGCGVNAGNSLKGCYSEKSGWVVITIGWGLAVTMAIYAVGNISGAHINPAVTLALAITGEFPWELVPIYIVMQILGAIAGATLVYFHYMPHWQITEDPGAKLGIFATGPAVEQTISNLFSEFFGTFILVGGLMGIGANEFTEGLNPAVVGLLIVAIGMSLGGTTGYAINPARDLGPRIAHFLLPISGKGGSNWRYSWVPVVGPLLGGAYAALFYKALFEGVMMKSFIGSTLLIAVFAAWTIIFAKRL